jgi:polyketide cyclase/dehydrase/lipid transport protein
MKILLSVGAGVVLLVIAVVVIGSLLPKRHVVSRSASYRATPNQLFRLIAGPQNWRTDVLHCEVVPDANGRELTRETTRDGNTVLYETLDRVPDRSMKRRIATPNLPYSGSWTYSLQPSGESTVVRITEDGEVYNPVFRFMSRFVLGHAHTMDAYLRALGKATGQEVQIKD